MKGTPVPVRPMYGFRRSAVFRNACSLFIDPVLRIHVRAKCQQVGKMRLRRGGGDVAIIGYGNPVNDCLAAAEMLQQASVVWGSYTAPGG